MKTYLIVHLKETDGDILILRKTADEIRKMSKSLLEETAIIDGEIVKPFDRKIDLTKLK